MRGWLCGCLLLAACSEVEPTPPDAGLPDDGGFSTDAAEGLDAADLDLGLSYPDADTQPDLGFDAGVDAGMDASFEPCGGGDAACDRAADCAPDQTPPSNCQACVPFNRSICAAEQCQTPPLLDGTDLYNVVVELNPSLPPLESLSTFAIAARTAGGLELECDDLYAGRAQLDGVCLNVLYSRAYNLGQSGNSYAVGFVGFPGGQRTLFLIQGHTQVQARGAPVARSCTAVDVGPPSGQGPYYIAGDRLEAR